MPGLTNLPTPIVRLRFYLGSLLGHQSSTYDLDGPACPREHVQTAADLIAPEDGEPKYARGYDRRLYDHPLLELLARCEIADRAFLYAGNDRVVPDTGPILVKNRRGSVEPVLLRCLNAPRHWSPVGVVDAPFHTKRNGVFWRGGSTGWAYRPTSRMALVERWGGRQTDIDVGFSHLCQEYGLPGIRERWEQYVKGKAPYGHFLRHKYLLSVEGNDKDSGLNWKLRANSVVLMAAPVAQSWLMEPLLRPFVHYVPLKDDFSDLATQLAWCRRNQAACERVIGNAHRFMSQFDNEAEEAALEREVIRRYFARVRGGPALNSSQRRTICKHLSPTSGASSRTRRHRSLRAMPFMRTPAGSPATS
jgi:hypothetical protein